MSTPTSAHQIPAPTRELRLPGFDAAENITLELTVELTALPSEPATLLSKRGPGSQVGFSLELSPAGHVSFLTSGPAVRSPDPLPRGRPVTLTATFNPRATEIALYLDGQLLASAPKATRGYERPNSATPLVLANNQDATASQTAPNWQKHLHTQHQSVVSRASRCLLKNIWSRGPLAPAGAADKLL